jgi:hypothetical protein
MAFSESYREGNVFAIPFASQAVSTNAFDLVGIYASTSPIARVEIMSIDIAVISSGVSLTPQLCQVQLLRGSTASSTSAGVTPVNRKGWAGAPSAGSSATLPCSGAVSTASAVAIWADGFNVSQGWHFPPYQEMTGLVRPVIASGQRLHLRLTAPSTALTVTGTLSFREIGGGNAA